MRHDCHDRETIMQRTTERYKVSTIETQRYEYAKSVQNRTFNRHHNSTKYGAFGWRRGYGRSRWRKQHDHSNKNC